MTATTNTLGFTACNMSGLSWKVPEGRSAFVSSRKYGIRNAEGLFASFDGTAPAAWNTKSIPQSIIDDLTAHSVYPDAWTWIELRKV